MALMVAAVVLGQAFVTSVNQFVLAAASAQVTFPGNDMGTDPPAAGPFFRRPAIRESDQPHHTGYFKAQRPDSHSSWKRIIVALYVFWSLWDPVFLSLEAGRPGSRYDTVSVWSWSLAGKDPVFMEPEDPGKDRRAYGPPV